MTANDLAISVTGQTFDINKGMDLSGIGATFDLDKRIEAGMESAAVFIGWRGKADVDVECLACIDAGPPKGETVVDMCFYNRSEIFGGAVKHSGDARSGDDPNATAFGDKEYFRVNFASLPGQLYSLAVAVTIDNNPRKLAQGQRRLTFGTVSSPYLRIVDSTGLSDEDLLNGKGEQLGFIKLDVSYGQADGVVPARFVRSGSTFNFQNVTQTFDNGLEGVLVSLNGGAKKG